MFFSSVCCETIYSRSAINHMWILKNSKDLLENFKSRSFSKISSICTFDFSTLYTTLPHDKLKSRLKELIHKAFDNSRDFVILGYTSTYFSKTALKGKVSYTEKQVNSMLDFLIDNICSHLEEQFFNNKLAFQWAPIVFLS